MAVQLTAPGDVQPGDTVSCADGSRVVDGVRAYPAEVIGLEEAQRVLWVISWSDGELVESVVGPDMLVPVILG